MKLTKSKLKEIIRELVGKELTESVSKTILQQLGGNKFIAMTGAHGFVSHGTKGVSFRIGTNSKGINMVFIVYDRGRDLYNLEFGLFKAANYKVKKKYKGVYADQIGDIFENATGMYIKL